MGKEIHILQGQRSHVGGREGGKRFLGYIPRVRLLVGDIDVVAPRKGCERLGWPDGRIEAALVHATPLGLQGQGQGHPWCVSVVFSSAITMSWSNYSSIGSVATRTRQGIEAATYKEQT